jgi:hypothetical protein
VDIGFTPQQVVWSYYVFCAVFGIIALAVSSRLFKLIFLLVLVAIMLAVLTWISRQTPASVHFNHRADPEPEAGSDQCTE